MKKKKKAIFSLEKRGGRGQRSIQEGLLVDKIYMKHICT